MFVHMGNQELDESLSPSLGNGNLAFNVRSSYLYLPQVYNGIGTASHKAAIPNPQVYTISGAELSFTALDLRYATYTRVYNVPGSTCTVTQQQYVHSLFTSTRLMVTTITVSNLNGTTPCRIEVDNNAAVTTSPDLNKLIETKADQYVVNEYLTLTTETPLVAVRAVAVLSPTVPSVITAAPGQTASIDLFAAVADSALSNNAIASVVDMFSLAQNEGASGLFTEQVLAFSTFNRAAVEVSGNLALAQKINASRYALEIDIAKNSYGSSSSHGLATTADDLGRISWDAETWIFPAATVLRPTQVAPTFIEYRAHRLQGARSKAMSSGYAGAMFPWESGFTGIELCAAAGSSKDNCLLKQYVSGNVALSVRTHYYMSRDIEFLKKYAHLVDQAARFFASRAQPSAKYPGKYEITLVATPDPSAGVVTNSAYMNQIAKLTLEWFLEMGRLVPITDDFGAYQIAKGLIIPFDEVKQIHLAYEGYSGQSISAADVVLLNYPLQAQINASIVKNDLMFYQSKLDVAKTPSTTWAMHTIGWLQVGETERAAETFALSSKHFTAPFGVWHESDTDTASNYVSGAGAFMQSLLHGYGGMRVTPTGIRLKPTLPPGTESITFRSIQFRSTAVDITVNAEQIQLWTVADNANTPLVFLTTWIDGRPYSSVLILHNGIRMKLGTEFEIGYVAGEPGTF